MKQNILKTLVLLFMIIFNSNLQAHADEKINNQELAYNLRHENIITKASLEKKYNLTLGKNKYESAGCAGCHDNGVLGAPKPGHKDSWGSRIGKGWGNIVNNAVSGFNQMPPKGGNESISQSDIENIIAYMVS